MDPQTLALLILCATALALAALGAYALSRITRMEGLRARVHAIEELVREAHGAAIDARRLAASRARRREREEEASEASAEASAAPAAPAYAFRPGETLAQYRARMQRTAPARDGVGGGT